MKLNMEEIKLKMKLPVVMAPMFLIANPEMVLNACKAGIIGSFPALNARTEEILDEWMQEINAEVGNYQEENPDKFIAPWAVNFISHRTNKRYAEDLQLIKKHKPPIVITSLGDPSPVAEIVHAYGGIVFSDVINIKFAKKAIEKGADGLVLVASGAGGHGGTYNPFSFVHEVRTFFDGPIMLSGGMTKGRDVLAAELLGADFAYIGSLFIATDESQASKEYKQMVVESSVEDIVYTDAFSGVNANYLKQSIIQNGLDPENLEKKNEADFSSLTNKEVKAWRDIWAAGQGIGAIKDIRSIKKVIEKLETEYIEAEDYVVNKKRSIPLETRS